MVPGLAIEEFSTPPSSPVMATRTRKKPVLPTTNSVDYKPARDSPMMMTRTRGKTAPLTTDSVDHKRTRDSSSDLFDIQLGQ
jgi:hypothetical protein